MVVGVITHGVVAGHTVALVLGDVGEVGGVGDDTALLVDYFLMNSPADAKSSFYLGKSQKKYFLVGKFFWDFFKASKKGH